MILINKATGLQVFKHDKVKDRQGNEATVMGHSNKYINVWLQESHVGMWTLAQSFYPDVYGTEIVPNPATKETT